MKLFIKLSLFVFLFFQTSCKNKNNHPDTSNINVSFQFENFDKDFFAIDTMQMQQGIESVEKKYPIFFPFFVNNILGIQEANKENNFMPENLRIYLSISDKIFKQLNQEKINYNQLQKQIDQTFHYIKYYFPQYQLPKKVITYLGPLDALALMQNGEPSTCIMGNDFLCIGMQFYLGNQYSLYQDQFFITNIAPQYRSRRFSKEYIIADMTKLMLDDIYPNNTTGQSLIEQMINKGKDWVMLDSILINTPDSIKTGYSAEQLAWCKKYEGLIWSQLLRMEDLYSKEANVIQNFIGEAPTTQNYPPESPGNLGQWIGWQIIKKYAENTHPTLQQLLKTKAADIFESAKYKPK